MAGPQSKDASDSLTTLILSQRGKTDGLGVTQVTQYSGHTSLTCSVTILYAAAVPAGHCVPAPASIGPSTMRSESRPRV